LGVRYVLEGSLRKAGNRIRVTAQLVEAETGKHVWAERLQDEITEAVTIALVPAIADAEQHRAMRKPPGSLHAWAAYQRGLWHLGRLPRTTISWPKTSFARPSTSIAISQTVIPASQWQNFGRLPYSEPAVRRRPKALQSDWRASRSRSMGTMRLLIHV